MSNWAVKPQGDWWRGKCIYPAPIPLWLHHSFSQLRNSLTHSDGKKAPVTLQANKDFVSLSFTIESIMSHSDKGLYLGKKKLQCWSCKLAVSVHFYMDVNYDRAPVWPMLHNTSACSTWTIYKTQTYSYYFLKNLPVLTYMLWFKFILGLMCFWTGFNFICLCSRLW